LFGHRDFWCNSLALTKCRKSVRNAFGVEVATAPEAQKGISGKPRL
jgi:hypothetical protein